MGRGILLPAVCAAVLTASLSGSARAAELIHTTATLSQARFDLAATTVGSKALFAGGDSGWVSGCIVYFEPSDVVDIYDTATDLWTTATLSQARTGLAATSVGSKAMFAGGDGFDRSNVVDMYDDATGLWSTATLSQARRGLAATSAGSKALFAGGYGDGSNSNVVDVYDDAIGLWSTAMLSQARTGLVATSAGGKALFAGGRDDNSNSSGVVDIYDSDTGLWSTATLSQPRCALIAATVGSKAMFAGGYADAWTSSQVVDIYDAATGLWSTATLSRGRQSLAATTVGTKVLFGGGRVADDIVGQTDLDIVLAQWGNSGQDITDPRADKDWDDFVGQADLDVVLMSWGFYSAPGEEVDIYDDATGLWSTDTLSQARDNLSATAAGNMAIFAGGWDNDDPSGVVDIFTLGETPVPEPTTLALLGGAAVAVPRRRRAAKH